MNFQVSPLLILLALHGLFFIHTEKEKSVLPKQGVKTAAAQMDVKNNIFRNNDNINGTYYKLIVLYSDNCRFEFSGTLSEYRFFYL